MSNTNLHTNLDDNFTIVNLVSDDEYNFNLEEKKLYFNVEKKQVEVNNTSKIDINNKENNNIINSQPIGVNNITNNTTTFPNNTKKENTQSVYYGLKNLIKLCLDI